MRWVRRHGISGVSFFFKGMTVFPIESHTRDLVQRFFRTNFYSIAKPDSLYETHISQSLCYSYS
jgi:hypothetical protein